MTQSIEIFFSRPPARLGELRKSIKPHIVDANDILPSSGVATTITKWNTVSPVTYGELWTRLESEPILKLKDRLVILHVPSHAGGNGDWNPARVSQLISAFPEVGFRLLSDDEIFRDRFSRELNAIGYILPLSALGDVLTSFIRGDRDWFDHQGGRRAARAALAGDRLRPQLAKAYVVEEEAEYRESLSYLAYRTGRYQTHVPRSAERVRDLFRSLRGSSEETGCIVHAKEIDFPGVTQSEKEVWSRRQHWQELLQGHRLWRFCVTGTTEDRIELRPTVSGSSLEENLLGWPEEDVLRGQVKPLGWFHDILASGVFNQGTAETSTIEIARSLRRAFFDAAAGSVRGRRSHSAPGDAQALAEILLARSAQAVAQGEPILGAIMALDAARLLRGRSSTTFWDAVSVLSAAEARAEVRLAAIAKGGGTAVTLRAGRLNELTKLVQNDDLLRQETVRDLKTRLWTELRRIYRAADAFDAAEEALLELHRVRRRRCHDLGRLVNCMARWWPHLGRLRRRHTELRRRSARFWRSLARPTARLRRAWRKLDWPHRERSIIRWLFFAAAFPTSLLFFRWWIRPEVLSPLTHWVTLGGTVACLLWVLIDRPDGLGWVGPALRPSVWAMVALACLGLVTVANSVLLWESPDLEMVELLALTVQQLLNIEVGPPFDEARLGGSQCDAAEWAHYAHWLVGSITGWAIFALGLSAIFRKATRG